ncbi:hypothetical protein RI054_04g22290 [Pseudoscourfieldia marina]
MAWGKFLPPQLGHRSWAFQTPHLACSWDVPTPDDRAPGDTTSARSAWDGASPPWHQVFTIAVPEHALGMRAAHAPRGVGAPHRRDDARTRRAAYASGGFHVAAAAWCFAHLPAESIHDPTAAPHVRAYGQLRVTPARSHAIPRRLASRGSVTTRGFRTL